MKTQTIKPASPLPWKLCDEDGLLLVCDKTGTEVLATHIKHDPLVSPLEYADHAYIVHACNTFPALVEAFGELIYEAHGVANSIYLSGTDQKASMAFHLNCKIDKARAALAAAKGTA